jgi:hypothetical protein
MMPRQIDGLEFQEVGEDVLVHDPNGRKIHVLNKTAATVLRACNGSRSLDQTVEDLMQGADVEKERVRADVATILEHFARLGLVTSER